MYSFFDLKDKVKKYFVFEKEEIRALLITTILIAFMLSFREWGSGKLFDLAIGLKNYFNAFLVVGLALIFHESAHKIYALQIGFKSEYKMWLYGLVFGLLFTFVTNGYFFILAVGTITVSMIAGHRLGFFRYGMNLYEVAKISFMGPFASVCLAIFFKMFSFMGNPLIEKAMIINIWIAIFAILPLPGLDGLNIYFGSRILYALGLGLVLGAALMIFFKASLWITIVGTILMGVGVFLIYLINVEAREPDKFK